jgi:hypothetical protein
MTKAKRIERLEDEVKDFWRYVDLLKQRISLAQDKIDDLADKLGYSYEIKPETAEYVKKGKK